MLLAPLPGSTLLRRRLADGLTLAVLAGLVTALALPAFRQVMAGADDETCLSRLHAIGAACRMYELDNGDLLVPYVLQRGNVQPAIALRWTSLVAPYVQNDETVFRCPLDHLDPARLQGVPFPTTYGMNWYISTMAGTVYGSEVPSRPYSFVYEPAATIRIADTAPVLKSTANLPPEGWREDPQQAPTADIYYFYLPQGATTGAADQSWNGNSFTGMVVRPFPRHAGFVNVAFYDGSAAPVPASQFDPARTRFGDAGCLWDNVAPYTIADAARALKIVAGLEPATQADISRLHTANNRPGYAVDFTDAVILARRAAGRATSP